MKSRMNDLRIGLIGVGGRGSLAMLAHKPGNGARLTALADPSHDALEKRNAEAGGTLFMTKDYRKLIERNDVDAVIICAPDFLHDEIAVTVLNAGKSVYLEKPMAITLEGCDNILKAAMKTKSKLYLGHNMRHMPFVIKMQEIINSGIIGKLQAVWCRHFIDYGGDAYFKDWHSDQKYSTGLLLQKGAHDIDVIHWLSGAFTRRVTGMGKLSVYDKCKRRNDDDTMGFEFKAKHPDEWWSGTNWPPASQKNMSKIINIEDHSMIMMQLENGVQANYMQCHYTSENCRNYTFIGDAGRIENIGDLANCKIHVYNIRGNSVTTPDIVYNVREINGGHGGADPRIIDEFVRFAKGECEASTCPIAAREAVATGYMGTMSIRNANIPMDVPPPASSVLEYFKSGQKRK